MSQKPHGSVAARARRAAYPQSTEQLVQFVDRPASAEARNQLQSEIAARIPGVRSHLGAVVDAIAGPDPEAAIVYLAMLRDACSDAIAAAIALAS